MKEGYRHIDCALIYKNEAEVGQGIKRSGVPREEIFITSKLWNTFHPNAAESLRRSLEDLGTDYLDLYVSKHVQTTISIGKQMRPALESCLEWQGQVCVQLFPLMKTCY